jgi:hypothetical protein
VVVVCGITAVGAVLGLVVLRFLGHDCVKNREDNSMLASGCSVLVNQGVEITPVCTVKEPFDLLFARNDN